MNRTFQRLEVFGTMTAYDNIRTAAEIAARARRTSIRGCTARRRRGRRRCSASAPSPAAAPTRCPTGQARLVELGRALATDPKVVLLDEPASGLDDVETGAARRGAAGVAATTGMAILLVEHDIDLVMRLSSTVYVLNLGELIAAGTPEHVRVDAAVQEAYLGAA